MNDNNNPLIVKIPEHDISNIEDIHLNVYNKSIINNNTCVISKITEYSDVIILSAIYLLNQIL